MGLQVPFAPYLLVVFFFFGPLCNQLFTRETQTNKVEKNKTNKQTNKQTASIFASTSVRFC